jgi:hypothetical protein
VDLPVLLGFINENDGYRDDNQCDEIVKAQILILLQEDG